MDDAKRDLIQAWLIKSRNDLDTARQISSLPEGHLDTAIYHCQQAAEKAIKGFLAFHDHELERTHDLKRLLQIAAADDGAFLQWMGAAITLTTGKIIDAGLQFLMNETLAREVTNAFAAVKLNDLILAHFRTRFRTHESLVLFLNEIAF